MSRSPIGMNLGDNGTACRRKSLLHQLCRWAIPAAFALGALALLLGQAASLGVSVVGLILAACPLICTALLVWQSREGERVLAAVGGVRDGTRRGRRDGSG